MPDGPLPQAEYVQIYSKVPRLTVEVVIVSNQGVLLTRREAGPCQGLWHIPGGTVRFGEPLTDAVVRVAQDELGIEVTVDRLLGYIEYPSHLDRGLDWPVGVAFRAHLDPASARPLAIDPNAGGWFAGLPEDMHDEQRRFLRAHNLEFGVPVVSRHHSELSDPELVRLSEVLRQLGATKAFSASEALSAALSANVVNTTADIDSAIDDLEEAGVLRLVQKNPPRWEAITTPN